MENFYLQRLLELKSNFSVKIITGVRGVGKSTLLRSFAEHLQGEEIIFIDYTDKRLIDFQKLYDYVEARTADLEKFFLLIDDVDRVAECEKAINALFVGTSAEIYLTCSSERLAEKLCALLPDNCDVLRMYPPSFAEYNQPLQDYLHFGASIDTSDKGILPRLLRGKAYEIMFDIVERNSLQKAELLRVLIKELAQNVGRPVSLNQISESIDCSGKAFRIYLSCAEELFRQIPRYDIKADKFLNVGEKFYCVDNGLLCALANVDETALMENALCIELLRRGYKVSHGKFGTMNISFVAERDGKKTFIQVLPNDGSITARRATRPLRALPDDLEKILITLKVTKTFGGVKNITLRDFLLNA